MGKHLLFTTSTELIRVPSESVVFISADGNYSSIKMADGGEYVLTLQLGEMEKRISGMVEATDNSFIRIGRSLIINREYITMINPPRQKIILSDSRNFRHELTASKEALKTLKELLEKEIVS